MTGKKTTSAPTRTPEFFEIGAVEDSPEKAPVVMSEALESVAQESFVNINPPERPSKKRFSILALFISVVAFLASLAGALWLEKLVRDLFARHEYLGYLGMGLTALAVLTAFILIAREILAIRRLAKITNLHDAAISVAETQNMPETIKLANAINGLYIDRPDMARARENFKQNSTDIFDVPDLLTLTESDLLAVLDKRARKIISATARRVAVVTAVSPRAVVDLAYVAYESVKLIGTLAKLYGCKPGLLGFFSLTKSALTHLAVTGGVAVGDSLIQQLIGHGIATKISSRVGEGFINGLMSVRVGIATLHAVRPLPYRAAKSPQVADFITELANFSKDKPTNRK